MFQTDLKKFFVINRVKKNCALTIVISDLKGEEIVGKFMKSNCRKTNQIEV